MAADVPCCETMFWVYLVICVALVSFSGLMSGLTVGLMSLSLVDLEVIMRAGQPEDRKNILPIVKHQHLLLCTLLIGNALAMEALPIFLDVLLPAWASVLISVTLILAFGGLLDWLLGKRHSALPRRAELKTLVDMHGNEAGKGGELTHDETTIITGALDMTRKTVKDAMTPISKIFPLDINSRLDEYDLPSFTYLSLFVYKIMMGLIIGKGHSRVPIYSAVPTNIIGLILVKNLIKYSPEDETPIRDLNIRRIPKDDIRETAENAKAMAGIFEISIHSNPTHVQEELKENGNLSKEEVKSLSILDEEIVGIITLEDVMEELLRGEILNQTDEYVDLELDL